MTTLEDFFATENPPPPDPLWTDLVDMVRERHAAAPRSRQRELGPSDVAHPCMRRMAYGMMEVERSNPEYDPLPSIIGTATHAWLESAAHHANEQLDKERWLTETRVQVAPGLSGTCDLYDIETATVIDFKVVGYTSFTAYRKDPGPQYRAQVQLYGRGFRNCGMPVERVAIAFFPRAGTLSRMHLWTAPYDDAEVDQVLRRREQVITLLNDLEIEANPQRYQWLPIEPYSCMWCPYFRPQPRSPYECSGEV